jgi:hypothetical protein
MIRIEILQSNDHGAQIWLACGVFLFVPLLDCEINLFMTFGMTLIDRVIKRP